MLWKRCGDRTAQRGARIRVESSFGVVVKKRSRSSDQTIPVDSFPYYDAAVEAFTTIHLLGIEMSGPSFNEKCLSCGCDTTAMRRNGNGLISKSVHAVDRERCKKRRCSKATLALAHWASVRPSGFDGFASVEARRRSYVPSVRPSGFVSVQS